MARRSTITDVARLAGVSVGTASNVLNDKGRHSDATRRRVLWAASESHFAPNALIRSLQSGQTNTVGVFTWGLHLSTHWSVSLQLLRGISLALSEASLDTLLYARHPHEGDVEATYFLDGRVDAVILAPGGLTVAGRQSLAASGLPGVLLYEREAPGALASVSIDNGGGIRAAVDHLVRLGHRRIGFVGPLYSSDFRERFAAYLDGLERHGLARDLRWVATGVTESVEAVQCAVGRLVRAEEPATAIVAGNDGIALKALDTARATGLRIPGDLSVVGFDDSEAGRLANLTTVAQPAEEVGAAAARFVAAMLAGAPGRECQAELPVRFVARETTGPPAYV